MKERVVGVLFVVSIFLCFSSFSHAQSLLEPNIYTCNNCLSFSRLADQKASQNINRRFHIVDVDKGVIKAYVGMTQIENFEIIGAIAQPTTVDPEVKAQFDDMLILRSNLLNFVASSAGVVHIPKDIADSAWDLSGSTKTINDVGDVIYNDLDLFEKFSAYSGAVVSLLGKVVNVNVVVTVKFEDGSSALYKISGVDSDDGNVEVSFEYLEGTGIDADNNTVSDSKSSFAGIWIFESKDAIQQFAEALERQGIYLPPILNCENVEVSCETSGNDMVCTAKSVSC